MAKYIEKVEQSTLPVIALRGAVAFPGVTLSFELTDELCIHAAEAAFETDSLAVICSVSDLSVEKLSTSALYRVGTVSKIKQSVKTPEGNMRIITEGYSRATVTEFHRFANYICADLICKSISLSDEESIKSQAYCRASDKPAPLGKRRSAHHREIYKEPRAPLGFHILEHTRKIHRQAEGA